MAEHDCPLGAVHGMASTFTRSDDVVCCDFCHEPVPASLLPQPTIELATLEQRIGTLLRIGRALETQDNAATAHPIYIVQSRRRIYGFDPDYADAPTWIAADEPVEATPEEAAEVEAEYEETGVEREDWTRTAYQDTWEAVTVCLTRAAAEQYIERQRHNLSHPRVYVESGYRNNEWIALRAELKALAALFPEGGQG